MTETPGKHPLVRPDETDTSFFALAVALFAQLGEPFPSVKPSSVREPLASKFNEPADRNVHRSTMIDGTRVIRFERDEDVTRHGDDYAITVRGEITGLPGGVSVVFDHPHDYQEKLAFYTLQGPRAAGAVVEEAIVGHGIGLRRNPSK